MRIPPGFEAVSGVSARGFARPEAVAWVEQALGRWGTLHRASRHESDVIEFTGRGTVRAVPAPDGEGRWVVRRYRRGGMLAPLLGDRYLRRGEPRPLRETRASEAARRSGIATPPVIAGVIYPAGAWYRADLVTRPPLRGPARRPHPHPGRAAGAPRADRPDHRRTGPGGDPPPRPQRPQRPRGAGGCGTPPPGLRSRPGRGLAHPLRPDGRPPPPLPPPPRGRRRRRGGRRRPPGPPRRRPCGHRRAAPLPTMTDE